MNIILVRQEELSSGSFSFLKNDERFRHIKKILKLETGSVFKAGIINGEKGSAEIIRFSEDSLTARFIPVAQSGVSPQPSALPHIRLILGFPRPIQLRRILRDVAGLGIEALYLIGTDLGEKSYLQSDLAAIEEIERLLIDGCCQAGETLIPQIYRAQSLRDFFTRYGADIDAGHVRAALDVPDAAVTEDMSGSALAVTRRQAGATTTVLESMMPLPDTALSQTAVWSPRPLPALQWNGTAPLWLAVGNERGWSRTERLLFAEKHFSAYSMGRRILRTETAVASAVAVCLALSGSWDTP